MPDPRQEYSVGRLVELRERLEPAAVLLDEHPLSVYVTGSYGRLEAWTDSDIDVFFLHGGGPDDAAFPYTTFIRLSAALIEATEAMDFPAFTDGGVYLEVQYVDQMERVLGSPEDDSLNAFTARMLLLLESRPLLNDVVYEDLLTRIVGFYFRDYQDNRETFLPTFLLSDILRFWRTLTLNYEHHRLKLRPLLDPELTQQKAKSALKNYKLKISRLATCFSMVARLSQASPPVTPEQVLALCHLTPSERFAGLRGVTARADELIDDLGHRYADFLGVSQQDEAALAEQFADPARRASALDEASGFGTTLYGLLREITPEDRLRYLLI